MSRILLTVLAGALVLPVIIGTTTLVKGCRQQTQQLTPFERGRLHAHEVCKRLHAMRDKFG